MKDDNPQSAQTQRLASLGFMLASVCHEVSNPLAAVSSMLQILQSKRGITPETLEKGLASIAANIARVTAITKKLGDYSRVGGEAPAPLAIDDAVEAAATLWRHSPAGHDVELVYRGAPGVTVLARPGELEQVLFNVMLNAAQAMQGTGRIEAQSKAIGGELTLSIRDSGPGIPAEHREHVARRERPDPRDHGVARDLATVMEQFRRPAREDDDALEGIDDRRLVAELLRLLHQAPRRIQAAPAREDQDTHRVELRGRKLEAGSWKLVAALSQSILALPGHERN